MPGILQRKIGPFPGWVWGSAAILGGLLFFYFRKQGQAAQQTGGLPAVSPAASAVPFVPSVTVTGIPPGTQPGGTPPTQPPSGGKQATIVSGGATLWNNGVPIALIPGGQTVNVVGPAQVPPYNPGDVWVQWGPFQGAVAGANVANYSGFSGTGGSGGWGYAGVGSLGAVPGGWTVGWQPFAAGSGAGSTVNRTGAARRARRLYGGSGGGQTVNRTGARATRPLRRRTLSGR